MSKEKRENINDLIRSKFNRLNELTDPLTGKPYAVEPADTRISKKDYWQSQANRPEDFPEPLEANPDTLYETDSVFYAEENLDGRKIKENWATIRVLLSDREHEVLNLVMQGKKEEAVAKQLRINRTTVKNYLGRAREKISEFLRTNRQNEDI